MKSQRVQVVIDWVVGEGKISVVLVLGKYVVFRYWDPFKEQNEIDRFGFDATKDKDPSYVLRARQAQVWP